ncbi:MAG: carboxypeptidase-like regulatory domain-containing protein [Bacteroidota bacterium]
MKWIILLFVLLTSFCNLAQEKIIGKLLDRQTNNPIPFAKIYNNTTKEGTITNEEGFFKIGVKDANDEILISQIGYKTQPLIFDLKITSQTVYLDANLQILDEVIAKPRDISYLCNLIKKCRSNEKNIKKSGKAYYELTSYIDTHQIELVEGFYNYTSSGYDLGNIEMKEGRLSIHPDDGRMFMSMESSKAITQLKLFEENPYFPFSPFDMKSREMEKKFYLTLRYKYLLENLDSIYVIDYFPKDTTGEYFEGTIWINKSNYQVLKVISNCQACSIHPFLPIFPTDEIRRLDMNITKTFIESNGKMCFNHVDFQYDISYKSRARDSNFVLLNNSNDSLYTYYDVKTKAVLYSYDQKNEFSLPKFQYTDGTSDYRKISALPYNSFFWENNNEARINDEKDKNQLFFADVNSIGNSELFTLNFNKTGYGGFIYTYKIWSKNRIQFRNSAENKTDDPKKPITNLEKYNLVIQFFADKNTYNDSINILTAAIFDPYQSYYHLEMDMATHCFINMYFDIHEIGRQELQKKLEANPENFDLIYTSFLTDFNNTKKSFLKQVERGTNRQGMELWNSYVVENLRIDNLGLFNPFPEEGE